MIIQSNVALVDDELFTVNPDVALAVTQIRPAGSAVGVTDTRKLASGSAFAKVTVAVVLAENVPLPAKLLPVALSDRAID